MTEDACAATPETAPTVSPRLDLFGDPIPDNWGGRGRPSHIPTLENRNRVVMLLALGWNNERIAAALDITPPTLRKSYKRELKFRDEQRDRLNAALAMRLWAGVQEGNVSAIREFQAFLEKNDLMTYGQTSRPEVVKEPKLGKKEAALVAARHPGHRHHARRPDGQAPGRSGQLIDVDLVVPTGAHASGKAARSFRICRWSRPRRAPGCSSSTSSSCLTFPGCRRCATPPGHGSATSCWCFSDHGTR